MGDLQMNFIISFLPSEILPLCSSSAYQPFLAFYEQEIYPFLETLTYPLLYIDDTLSMKCLNFSRISPLKLSSFK